MSGSSNRRTMGHDWGGRQRSNPLNAPVISRKQVLEAAEKCGVRLRRLGGGWSLWQYQDSEGTWRNLADTNFKARQALILGLLLKSKEEL